MKNKLNRLIETSNNVFYAEGDGRRAFLRESCALMIDEITDDFSKLAEENAKLRDSISAIQHSIAQYRVPGNDKWREVELIDEICLQALEG